MRILVIVLLIVNLLVFGIGTYFDDIRHYIESYIDNTKKADDATMPDALIIPIEASEATDNEAPVNKTDTTTPQPDASDNSSALPETMADQAASEQRLACIEIGPISQNQIPELRRIIGTLPRDSSIRTYPQASNSGPFWVYLPAADTLAEQQKQIAMLRQKGIQDYFIVQAEGSEKGAVSLGVFRYQTGAKNLLAQMINKGIPAQIGNRTTGMFYVRITQAPQSIENQYPIIRQRFPTAHTIGDCRS